MSSQKIYYSPYDFLVTRQKPGSLLHRRDPLMLTKKVSGEETLENGPWVPVSREGFLDWRSTHHAAMNFECLMHLQTSQFYSDDV